MTDWRSAVGKPPAHRISKDDHNTSLNSALGDCNSLTKVTTFSIFILLISFFAMLLFLPRKYDAGKELSELPPYNSTYPLTPPLHASDNGIEYRLVVITDLDHASKIDKEKHTWQSFMRRGILRLNTADYSKSDIIWETETIRLKSTLSQGGRGMELSDLAVFNGQLISVDDRTGVLYRINGTTAVAWVMLVDGDGHESKGFKGEWLAVKDGLLYVGGLGKEWTTTQGEFVNHNPMWVKTVTHYGYVRHLDWRQAYVNLRAAAGIHYPGYMIHESARWSSIQHKWFFIPRRASTETYTEEADERRATNIMIIANEDFSHVEVKRVGELSLTRGTSAFQFVPGTNDKVIIALKSEEDKVTIASYILMFDIDGRVIVPETKLEGSYKFEGIEFV